MSDATGCTMEHTLPKETQSTCGNDDTTTDEGTVVETSDGTKLTSDRIEKVLTASDEQTETQEENELVKGLEEPIDPAIVEKLRVGFLQTFLPSLEKSQSCILEVLANQKILIETVEQENTKFQECQAMKELTHAMTKARKYHSKLLAIKKDMTSLHEKSARLKKRAVRLQQNKQREEMQKAQQREREHEKERMLSARVAKSSDH